jgi:hypothetical protein
VAQQPQVVILEVGIGGRIDATNVIQRTAVTGGAVSMRCVALLARQQTCDEMRLGCCRGGHATWATHHNAPQHTAPHTRTHAHACTGITSLGFDHMELLGDTLDLIAREKAGIMRPHVPCFTVQQLPEAMAALQARACACADLGARVGLRVTAWGLRHVDAPQRTPCLPVHAR